MEQLMEVLSKNHLVVLFLTAAIGLPLGRIKIGGVGLGVAMVVFVGIALGAIDHRLKVPDDFYLLGLSLFIFCVGLSSAQGFFNSLNKKGLRQTGLAIVALLFGATIALLLGKALGVAPRQIATMFCGAMNSTPALAGVVQSAKDSNLPASEEGLLVVAYAIAYPLGAFIPLFWLSFSKKLFKVNLKEEAETIAEFRTLDQKLGVETVFITNPAVTGIPVKELVKSMEPGFTFGRYQREGATEVASGDTVFQLYDLVTVVGPASVISSVIAGMGDRSDLHIERDGQQVDYRRVFVSNEDIAGKTLAELDLPNKLGAVVTRVRRGDVEFLPSGRTILQLGDRVRVLAAHEDQAKVSRFFGDRYRSLTEGDLFTLCLGLALGLLLGEIPIPLPGGTTFKLGFAGGPLLVALVLGKIQRTGPIVWNIPYSANMTLREFGLATFAAGIGLKAGAQLMDMMKTGGPAPIFIGGAAVSVTVGLVVMVVGYKAMKLPLNTLFGVYAGACTQPVVLAVSRQHTENEIPNASFATVYPLATIAKILIAQVLFLITR